MKSRSREQGLPEESHSPFVNISFGGGVLTIAPTGTRLTEREAVEIANEIRPAMARCMKKLRVIVLDLTGVGMMTSFGLGMCVEIRNTAQTLGVRTVVTGLKTELADLFEMVKVDRLFTIAHDENELMKALAA